MKSLFDIAAPAKLNLFLHIVGRRPDGYHLLESVFVLIDWCDTLHFELCLGGQISREDLTLPLPADDLIVRSAKALQKLSGTPCGAHIAVEKRIPSQAGMGGGSSDAASTLLALNRLWSTRLSLDQLMTLGLQLGADVPFFLGGRNAWIEGIGEKITPVEVPMAQFVVVKPAEGLDTRRIFLHPNLKRDTQSATLPAFAEHTFDFGHNDFQPVAMQLCPGVSQAIDWLKTLGLVGKMTGSGSAVFARTRRDVDLKDAPASFQIKTCQGLSVHPLLGWAV